MVRVAGSTSSGWLGGDEEFAEEAALGEELVLEDATYVGGLGVRLVVEVGVGEDAPRRDDFVGFAHVGVEEVLIERVSGLRDRAVGYGGVRVVH